MHPSGHQTRLAARGLGVRGLKGLRCEGVCKVVGLWFLKRFYKRGCRAERQSTDERAWRQQAGRSGGDGTGDCVVCG